MGTRNLTMVVSNNETKIAQYGQWDGYPDGQGKTILEFLKSCDLKEFRKKVDSLRFYTNKEIQEINRLADWTENYPFLSRNIGGEILEAVYNNKVDVLEDFEEFAAQSLHCEWAYVVDLDKNFLEVYEGFNKNKLKKNERFYHFEAKSKHPDYHPIRLIKKYPLLELPYLEDFINDLTEEEEEVDPNHIL